MSRSSAAHEHGGLLDWENIEHLAADLAVPNGRLGALSKERRSASIAEALTFPIGGGQLDRLYTQLYGPFDGLSVGVGKPGKEADPARKKVNQNDMTPCLLRDGEDLGYRPSFGDVFSGIQEHALGAESHGQNSLQVLGALFFRNAFMLDHVEIRPGIWRYSPPAAALEYLEAANPTISGIPVRPLLFLIEALALNEDVKYNPAGSAASASGRQNNLLTCAHITAVFLNLASIGRFVDGMTRGRGVAPLSQQAGLDLFRLLRWPGTDSAEAFEDQVLQQLSGIVGKSIPELAAGSGLDVPGAGHKSRVAYVFTRSLPQTVGVDLSDRLTDAYNVKTIRVRDDGLPAEDISFPAIRQDEAVRQNWSSSDIRRLWTRPFLFAVFTIDSSGNERFKGAAFCAIPADDLDDRAQAVWKTAVQALIRGEREACPKKSESDFFVRNKAAKKTVGPDGETTTPLAFWLSRDYVKALIEGSRKGIGDYGR